MFFGRVAVREAVHAFGDFDHAFLALALFAAGRRHPDSQRFGALEQRTSGEASAR